MPEWINIFQKDFEHGNFFGIMDINVGKPMDMQRRRTAIVGICCSP